MKPIRCCKDCTRRHVGCHGTCEDYIQEKSDYDKCKDEEYRKRKAITDQVNYTRKAIKRMSGREV